MEKLPAVMIEGLHILYIKLKKGNFMLYTERWSRWQSEGTSKKYEVYESIKVIPEEIPDGLIYEAKEELEWIQLKN